MTFTPRDPAYRRHVEQIFEAPFVQALGIRPIRIEPGEVETELVVRPDHLQQDGVVHAGVLATLADHSAGGAAGTLAPADHGILTIEFKINLLRPATGRIVRCRAVVLRPGSTVTIAESEVSAGDGETFRLCAKAMVTLAVVAPADVRR
ncbi:MAG: PaaI family thioesterase [Deltaproteobacteria bacterium]|nr:PaaI family thioesterase [Deltaproteobacteria bacterium]